jgi:hypothetical protein
MTEAEYNQIIERFDKQDIKEALQMVGGAAEIIDLSLRTGDILQARRTWDVMKPNLEKLKKFILDMLAYSKE